MAGETGRLAYVALALRDPAEVADIFERHFDLARRDARLGGRSVPLLTAGEAALALFSADDPFLAVEGEPVRTGVHHIGLASGDPAGVAGALGLPTLIGPMLTGPMLTGEAEGLDGGRQVLLDPDHTVGIRVRLCEPVERANARGGPVQRIDHLGIASADNAAGKAVFAERMGFPVESEQTDIQAYIPIETFTSDKYGVVYHTQQPVVTGGLRDLFVTIGDCELEFLQNFDPNSSVEVQHGRSGDTKQDQGAIAGYVQRYGPGLHHLGLKTDDIDAALTRLGEAGVRTIDRTGRPGGRASRIGFIHPKAMGGVLMHFVERRER